MSISIFRSLIGGLLARYWPLLAALFIVAFLVFLPDIAYAQGVCRDAKIARLLSPECLQQGSPSYWVIVIWRLSLSIVNVAAVLFLIIIALATILHWNIDTYGFKKALPTMVIGIVLANFSMLIVRAMVDVANILTVTFAGDARAVGEGIAAAIFGGVISPAAGLIGYPIVWIFGGALSILFALIAALFVVLIPALLFLVLYFLLFIRITIIMVFAAIAPLAFATLALPGLRGLFSRWFGTIVNWIFMAPAVFLLLRIASEVGTFAAFDNANPGTFVSTMLPFTIALGAVVMAIMVPFKMGGAIMAAWGGVGAFITGTRAGGYTRTMFESVEKAGAARKQELYLRTPLGRLQSYLDLRAGAAEQRLEGQKAATEAQLRSQHPEWQRIASEVEHQKRELERVKEQLQTNIDLGDEAFLRARRTTEQAITVAKAAREKRAEQVDQEAYADALRAVNQELLRPGVTPQEQQRLRLEAGRYQRLLDQIIKDDARALAEDNTPRGDLGGMATILQGGTVADSAGVQQNYVEMQWGTQTHQVRQADLQNFASGNSHRLAPGMSTAIETKMLELKEWLNKGPNNAHFYEAVEMGTELARAMDPRRRWHLDTMPLAARQALAQTDPQRYRQFYIEASRELQLRLPGLQGRASGVVGPRP